MTDNNTHSYHYQTIVRALEALDHSTAPISLEELAQRLNMSPTYFQKLFSKWVGVSPKRYQQYLQLTHAKSLLQHHHSALDTSLNLNLSSTSRLHDLFCTWEAMTPGDYKKAGQNLTIFWGEFTSPFGPVIAMGTQKGICGLGFSADLGSDATYQDLAARWPNATFIHQPSQLDTWIKSMFHSENAKLPLHLIGAPFQLKVWEALLHIPSGTVSTYSDIARAINSPKAVRAVGTAVGRNPVSLLIPCHRALRKSGALGGYHWGLPLKRAMLAYESARRDGDISTQISE